MKRKRVLLVHSDITSKRALVNGVLLYARTHEDWEIYLCNFHNMHDVFRYNPKLVFNGIITNGPATIGETLPADTVVCYNQTPFADIPARFGRVICDEAAIGIRAARFFVDKGAANFAYVATMMPEEYSVEQRWSDQRRDAFAKEVADAGFSCSVFADSDPESGIDDVQAMGTWLKSLPKPCALFAANDMRAMDVILACGNFGIAIPPQIAVLGVDNEEYICEYTRPSLSSILPDFEAAGQMSARLLDDLMDGVAPSGTVIRYGVKTLIERMSTHNSDSESYSVIQAMNFIRSNCMRAFSVCDTAKAVRCSTAHLGKSFRHILGSTVVAEIAKARMGYVCDLLLTTSLSIDQIAATADFKSANSLRNTFRKHYGMSMTEWRARQRAASRPPLR